MGTTKSERLRRTLLKKKQEILQTCNALEMDAQVFDEETPPDVLDQALGAYAQEFASNLSETERRTLRLVDDALERLDGGKYGSCVHCTKKIQPNRIDAVPWARHCLDCQDLQDRGLLEENAG